MSLGLDYRFTFITVQEESEIKLRPRAASVPPRLSQTGSEACCDAQANEVQDWQYVQKLQKKLVPIFSARNPEAELEIHADSGIMKEIPVDDAPSMKKLEPACNPGSAGHPELCRRPCIYFAVGQCVNSSSCNFCHLSHSNRSATLDKSQRQLIKEMTHYEFLSVLLRCMQMKAVESRFETEAQDVLELFKWQLTQEKTATSKVPKSKVMNLEKAISRMTFFSVVSLSSRFNLSVDFLDQCRQKVADLRQKISGPK